MSTSIILFASSFSANDVGIMVFVLWFLYFPRDGSGEGEIKYTHGLHGFGSFARFFEHKIPKVFTPVKSGELGSTKNRVYRLLRLCLAR